MWYVSGNRDETAIEEPERFVVGRAKPRHHLAFGAGIHRCVGDRLAEMQLRILWEELLKRDLAIELAGPPVRLYSNFIRGIRAAAGDHPRLTVSTPAAKACCSSQTSPAIETKS